MTTQPLMKVGITGAEGNIGSTLREGLADQYQIRSFTLDSHYFLSTVADLTDAEAVQGIFDGLDTIIHLAGEPSPRASWDSVLNKNIIATYNVFEEARRAGVKKIVFASTNHTQHGETMQNLTPNQLNESMNVMLRLNDPPHPDSLYAVSKLFGENIGRYYATAYGMQVVALRIGATFQADDPSVFQGEPHESYMRAMFLSKRDCVEAFRKALEVETGFMTAYAVSNNDGRIFDLRETEEKLGFYPQDKAENY
ncbi:MAG: NAD(P)-dependent oxidoreductase [Chloroflexota bacterium]